MKFFIFLTLAISLSSHAQVMKRGVNSRTLTHLMKKGSIINFSTPIEVDIGSSSTSIGKCTINYEEVKKNSKLPKFLTINEVEPAFNYISLDEMSMKLYGVSYLQIPSGAYIDKDVERMQRRFNNNRKNKAIEDGNFKITLISKKGNHFTLFCPKGMLKVKDLSLALGQNATLMELIVEERNEL